MYRHQRNREICWYVWNSINYLKIKIISFYQNFILDKIYAARHKMLNLPKNSVIVPEIPTTYFSTSEQDFNSSALVETLSSMPNSPLTPGGFLQNFTPTLSNPPFQNQFGNRMHDFPSLTPANLRYHALQQQALQQQVNNQNIVVNAISYSSGHPSISPRSTNTNTSGYLSHSSNICVGGLNISGSSSSMEQLYAPYKPAIQINGNGFENDDIPFETENRLLTPNYYSVS